MDKKHIVKHIRANQAISEIIGTMLILGISVGLFSVVYISVLTVPYSPPTPSVNIICQIGDGNIILSHYGGKALNFDSKIVLVVDGQPANPIPAGDYLYNDSNGDGLWSVGEKIVFSYASLVSGGEQIEINILDTGINSLVMTGTFQEEIDSVLSIFTSVDAINPYELTSSPFDITATGPLDLDNVTLYYRWSDDNSTWDATLTEFANGQTDNQIKVSFDPRPNEPPVAPVNPDPANGTVDVKVPVTLCVDVYDETGYTVDVYFYNAPNDTLIGVDYNVPSDWSTASVVWNEPIKGRICYWYAIAKDHEFENRSETWIFATR